jgi:hypothetical protein
MGRTCKIPKLEIIYPQRLFMNFIVGVNDMCFNKFCASEADMILIPTTGL